MKTKYLSKEEREEGLQHYLNWATFNGFGFSFLGDTIVYLLAIHFGASNTQLGYISSIIHVSGIILLFLPRLTRIPGVKYCPSLSHSPAASCGRDVHACQ